jgi:hydroxyacylglutathione hydrolase
VDVVVNRFALGPLQTNCYVVRAGAAARTAVVVDPGGEAAELIVQLEELGTSCAAILVTHGHFDHIGGVADLAESSDAPVYMPEGECERLERYAEFAPAGVPGRSHTPDHVLAGDETIVVAGLSFECVSIPGHSPAHIAFFTNGHLFSGDLLFAGSIGRVDLPGGDWDTLLESVRRLADRFSPETIVHPGHGPETTLGAELEGNPFLAELRA